MTPEQTAFFRERGYLLLPGVIKKERVQPIKIHVLNELQRLNIWASGKTLSKRMKDVPAFQQITKLTQLIKYPGLQERIIAPDLLAKMQKLAGASLKSAQDAQLLLSLPHQGDWTLDGLNWHLDISPSKADALAGIQAFVLIDDLAAHGGATLALAGSHRLRKNDTLGQQNIRSFLSNGAARDITVDGIELSIVEMTGRAGDVYLMDMRVIHTPSINSTKKVRMMATARYFLV
jgi:hypothetical protein